MLGSLTLGRDGTDDFPARRGCHRPRSSGIPYPKRRGRLPRQKGMPEPAPPSRKRRSIPSFSEGVSSPKGQASEDGKIRALCMIRGACAAKAAPSWQDLRAVYSQTAVCGAFRMHSAHILPKPAHFGYTAAICCHELAIFPSEATFGMHGAQNLPRIAAWERISRAFFHRQAPGNAPRRNLATARHSGTHRGGILPRQGTRERTARVYCHCQSGQERIRARSCHHRTLGTHLACILPSSSARETHIRNVLPTERHLRAGGPIALP